MAMAETLILEFTGIGESEYDAVNSKLGLDTRTGEGHWPAGMLSHAAGTADDGAFVVTEVWASRADQAAFMQERLGAALAAGGITAAPRVRWVPLLAYHVPGR
jgi:hypothetical protein